MEPDTTLTVDEAAALLGVNRRAVYRAIQRGSIPYRLETATARRFGKDTTMTLCARDIEAYRRRTQPEGKPTVGRPRKPRRETIEAAQ